MKKTLLLLIILNILSGSINAQKSNLNGVWKLTESYEYAGKTQTNRMYLSFKDTGVLKAFGREIGAWVHNESENTLTVNCDRFDGIKGANKIEKLDEKELKLIDANGESKILERISLPESKKLTNKLTGEWLMEKVEKDGKTDFVGQVMNLNSNGVFYAEGFVFGTWGYNKAAKKITFDVNEEGDPFNGEHTVIKVNKSEFIIDMDGAKAFFSKIDHELIAKENNASGLIGTWKLDKEENSDVVHILKLDAPDKFVFVEKTEYSTSKSKGTWTFNKKEKTVVLIGRLEKLRGLNKVISSTSNKISLENNGTVYSLKKEAQLVKIEHLTFTQKDFYLEDGEGDFKYYDDEQKLPWKDSMEMMMTLVNVKQLVYKYSSLIEEVNVFESKILTADVNSKPQEQSLNIDPFFKGYDRYNLPEDAELPRNEIDEYNKLYPEEDNTFRVVGEEEITTPAGTFNCTVIEVIDGSDRNKKLWMINNKPGIYAKIIDENRDERFGHYLIYELQEIK